MLESCRSQLPCHSPGAVLACRSSWPLSFLCHGAQSVPLTQFVLLGVSCLSLPPKCQLHGGGDFAFQPEVSLVSGTQSLAEQVLKN